MLEADSFSRFIALVIDAALCSAALAVFLTTVPVDGTWWHGMVFAAFKALSELVFGRSLGQKLLNVRVYHSRSPWYAVPRNSWYIIPTELQFLFLVKGLVVVFSPDHRSVLDKLCGATVVKDMPALQCPSCT